MSLQSLEQREVGVEFIMASLYHTSLAGVISTTAARTPMLAPSHPRSLYINLFTLDPAGMLQGECPQDSIKLPVHQT